MQQLITGIIVTVVGGLILWGIQSMATSRPDHSIHSSVYQRATLTISSTNSDIAIYESNSGIPYEGGNISSTNSDQVIYLPKGQQLTVNLIGTGSDLKISKSIADQVSVNNSGTNSDVILF